MPRDPTDEVSVTASQAMEDIVDVNRSELLYWRWQTYESLADLKVVLDSIANDAGKELLKDALRKLIEPTKPYSAMSHYFLKEKWGVI